MDILVWKFACFVSGHIHVEGKGLKNGCLYVLYSLHIIDYEIVL